MKIHKGHHEQLKKSLKRLPYLVTIPSLSPSLNKYRREHWSKRRLYRKDFGEELMVGDGGRVPKVGKGEKRKVKIVSYRKSLVDRDNLIGGMKPLIDALKDRRLIFDDDDAHLELEVELKKVKSRAETKTDIFIFLTW